MLCVYWRPELAYIIMFAQTNLCSHYCIMCVLHPPMPSAACAFLCLYHGNCVAGWVTSDCHWNSRECIGACLLVALCGNLVVLFARVSSVSLPVSVPWQLCSRVGD